MSVVTVNGEAVTFWRIPMPRIGMWTAELRVDADADITGQVTVQIGDGLQLKGTVVRGGAFALSGSLFVVGGAGGMSKIATPRHYNDASVSTILGHLLGDAGERLSDTIDASVLNRNLASWTTAALPTGALIARLVATLGGLAWRVLPDGSFWLGEETWPDSGLVDPGDYTITAEDPSEGSAIVASLAPLLLPGTTLDGRRLSRVEKMGGGAAMNERVWFETEAAPGDRMAAAWKGAIGGDVVDVFYRGSYIGKVVQQEDDAVDVEFDDERLPSMAKVPLFAPGGTRQTSAEGGRCVVAWGAADPSQPYVIGFDADTVGGTYKISAKNIILDGVVDAGGEGGEPAAKATTLATWLASHTHSGVTAGAVASGPPVVPPTPFAALNARVK